MEKEKQNKVSKRSLRTTIVLTLSVLLVLFFFYTLRKENLPRDKDQEFKNGSGIQITSLSDFQTESLYKLCKVWGYAKYHHPSVIDGTINWDAELFRIMPHVLDAQTNESVNQLLAEWLAQFPIKTTSDKLAEDWKQIQKDYGKQTLDATWIEDTTFLGNELSAYLCKLSQILISDRSHSYASFEKNGCVSFDAEKTYPVSDTDSGMKLLGLFRFWNMYEYYSPNIEITVKDWDQVLMDTIPAVAKSTDYRSYVLALAQAIAMTGDAHITLHDKEQVLQKYYGSYYLPCSIKMIDGQAVVDYVYEKEKQLQPGDVLLEIDEMPISQRIGELKQYRAIPNNDKILRQMEPQLLQAKNEKAKVLILRGNKKETMQIKTIQNFYSYQNPLKTGLLEENIGYIDPSKLKEGELETRMEEFQNTKGIIVDLRYYPSVFIPYLMGEYIVPNPQTFVIMGIPNQAIPGAYWQQNLPVGKGVMKELAKDDRQFDTYNGKVIILMDETSQSNTEFTIMALRQSPNAVVVGSPSIGADGDVVSLSLPGEIQMNMTGLGVYTPEGEQTQRCGLTPDVECYPTIEGLRQGKDELIDTAVNIILENK